MTITPSGKSIVALCDGTANHLGTDLSNIVRLFRCLDRGGEQVSSTILALERSALTNGGRGARGAKALFEQVTGYAVDRDIIEIYRFICATYEPGDRLFLFGFSRGAYTVRIVASLLQMIGVLPRDQMNLAGYISRSPWMPPCRQAPGPRPTMATAKPIPSDTWMPSSHRTLQSRGGYVHAIALLKSARTNRAVIQWKAMMVKSNLLEEGSSGSAEIAALIEVGRL